MPNSLTLGLDSVVAVGVPPARGWVAAGFVDLDGVRGEDSARVMLVRAGLNPAGAEGVRPPGALPQLAA